MSEMLGLTDPSLMNDLSGDLLPLDLDLDSLPHPTALSTHGHQTPSLPPHATLPSQSPVAPSKEEPQDDSIISPTAPPDPSDIPMSMSDTITTSTRAQISNPNAIGAGPLPTGFGVQLPPSVGSTLTEFTKRRNWSQRVVEELRDFLHILTPDGRFLYVSPSARHLTGHEPANLIGQFISAYIHPDDGGTFGREFHESIASGNPLRFFYRFKKPDGSYAIFESHGHPHYSSEQGAQGYAGGGSGGGVSFCRGFFMMARPYPSKNAALLDSFLEHKIENERLKKRIADLRREEQEDIQQTQHLAQAQTLPGAQQTSQPLTSPSVQPSERPTPNPPTERRHSAVPASPSRFNGMPPPAKPNPSTTALTSHNLSEALASSQPDSINDKMARYEGLANHLETIEMLTGLRYKEGERSKGISTGAASPTLVRGDQGIDILIDNEGRQVRTSGTPPGGWPGGGGGGGGGNGNTWTSNGLSGGTGPGGAKGWGGWEGGDAGSAEDEREREKKRKMKVADEYVCTDCGTLDSPEWRRGPNGPKTLCNACGLRWAKKEKKRSEQTGPSGGSNSGNSNANNPSANSNTNASNPQQQGPTSNPANIPTPSKIPAHARIGGGGPGTPSPAKNSNSPIPGANIPVTNSGNMDDPSLATPMQSSSIIPGIPHAVPGTGGNVMQTAVPMGMSGGSVGSPMGGGIGGAAGSPMGGGSMGGAPMPPHNGLMGSMVGMAGMSPGTMHATQQQQQYMHNMGLSGDKGGAGGGAGGGGLGGMNGLGR